MAGQDQKKSLVAFDIWHLGPAVNRSDAKPIVKSVAPLAVLEIAQESWLW
jgi:hypothetical protein